MNLSRYYHTVKYLKPVQIYGRILFKLKRPRTDFKPAPDLRERDGTWCAPVQKNVSMLSENRFRFLEEQHDVVSKADWNNPAWDKLWLYNLHYFDDLGALDADSRYEWHTKIVDRWISENPPPYGNGWEPYTLSLRIVNWIKWVLGGKTFSREQLHSLAVQSRFLKESIEEHIKGNHLLANAKALVFTGLFFKGAEADGWLNTGLTLLDRELPEQVLPDGGHFERSPMYHCIILEDILDLINIMKTCNRQVPAEWVDFSKRMGCWLIVMTHPDGDLVLFNDTALGISATLKELDEYSVRLGLGGFQSLDDDLIHLTDSGYVRFRKGPAVVFIDVAPIGPDYQPGHAHADTLSFELSLSGRRVIVDSGVSGYGNSNERKRQRGTGAHNTVTVDGEDSSEVWSGFRVARRARVHNVKVKENPAQLRVSGSHDGFGRLRGVGNHERIWELNGRKLTILDRLDGKGEHSVEISFHLHPKVEVQENESHLCRLRDGSGKDLAVLKMDRNLKILKVCTTYHPRFGVSMDNIKVVGSWKGEFPVSFSNSIVFEQS